MDPLVRGSVAALFEGMFQEQVQEEKETNLHFMLRKRKHVRIMADAISASLKAGGHTPKDVGDWLRQPLEPTSLKATMGDGKEYDVSRATVRSRSVPAKYPQYMDEAQAIEFIAAVLVMLDDFSTYTVSELSFLESLRDRVREQKRWISMKQAAWLRAIYKKKVGGDLEW